MNLDSMALCQLTSHRPIYSCCSRTSMKATHTPKYLITPPEGIHLRKTHRVDGWWTMAQDVMPFVHHLHVYTLMISVFFFQWNHGPANFCKHFEIVWSMRLIYIILRNKQTAATRCFKINSNNAYAYGRMVIVKKYF
jgi:hypothetical protein